MDAKLLLEGINDLVEKKGISKDDVLTSLKEAIIKAYAKEIGDAGDARIDLVITDETFDLQITKTVVKDEDGNPVKNEDGSWYRIKRSKKT